ncbi:hypothetical protein EDC01DRAFT_448070 [Geopyxis carbonaria]|nr:hypothetical protein EDC01DRAFT_448070 [Geopyxis carbonaria]
MSVPTNRNPSIVLLALDFYEDLIKDIWCNVLMSLNSMSKLTVVTTIQEAMEAIPQSNIVILGDGHVIDNHSKPKYSALTSVLKQHVHNSGRTLLMATACSAVVQWPELDLFFQVLGIPWSCGAYTSSDWRLVSCTPGGMFGNLKKEYQQNALCLHGVAFEDAVYIPGKDSHTNTVISAWTQVGKGHVGWVGDVNPSEMADSLILRMCGVMEMDPELSDSDSDED